MARRIVFTGGGSAGHVTVNLALIPHFLEEGWEVYYIGSEKGIEKQLITSMKEVEYFGISTGKLRRYIDLKNLKDPFRVAKGIFQASRIIRKIKPDVVFSKGGFVAVPVVVGAWLNRIPILIHESDFTPGLANKLSIPFASKVLLTFPETQKSVKEQKALYVGSVVRDELRRGDAKRGQKQCEFSSTKPVLLVMGGSLGAQKINEAIRANLTELLSTFQIVHLCGKGNIEPELKQKGYVQYEYLQEELPDILAMTDIVVSRAGSNSIFEFLALKKPMLLIPLSKKASRGDQILNAQSFEKSGFCEVLYEEDITSNLFLNKVLQLYARREQYIDNMQNTQPEKAIEQIRSMIKEVAKNNGSF